MQKKSYRMLTGGCIFLYALFMLYSCLHIESMAPDERWFMRVLDSEVTLKSLRDIVNVPNYLGYGAIYWIILKFLGSFLRIRFFSFLLLLSIPICITFLNRKLGYSERGVFLSCILYLSCPLSWFTGKIIGPEIMGWAVGTWGGAIALAALLGENRRAQGVRLFLAGIFLGIAAGVKLNYVVFYVFIISYIILDVQFWKVHERRLRLERFQSLFGLAWLVTVAFIIGLLVSNPIIITDLETFRSTYSEVGGYSLYNLNQVLFLKRIEWDLVNSGGMDSTIISVTALVLIVVIALRKGQNKFLVISGLFSILLLLGLCCKTRFLGWYLLPLITILCLIVPDRKFMAVILMANAIFMLPNVRYQIVSKAEQIDNMRQIDSLEGKIRDWETIYPDYDTYYFVEVCLDEYPMFPSYRYETEESQHRLIFISKRARANTQIAEIYDWGKQITNGYRLLEEEDNLAVIVYEEGL